MKIEDVGASCLEFLERWSLQIGLADDNIDLMAVEMAEVVDIEESVDTVVKVDIVKVADIAGTERGEFG